MSSSRSDPEAVHKDYDNHELSLIEVADKHKMSLSSLNRMRIKFGWKQRQARNIDPNDLLMRMFGILETQTIHMEKYMVRAGSTESAVLGRLVVTLDRLIVIKNKATKSHPSRRLRARDIDALRIQIADRVDELSGR